MAMNATAKKRQPENAVSMATHLFDRMGHGNSKLPVPASKKVAKNPIKNQGPALTGHTPAE
jgi:hypothetical protein